MWNNSSTNIITYERNVIVGEDRNFIFRRLGQENEHILHPIIFKYFREEGSLLETISLVNEDIGFFNMIKLAVIDSILLNIDINVFVFSFKYFFSNFWSSSNSFY